MSLRDPELKIQRAKEHLDALDLAHEAFAKSEPYTITRQDDLESGHYILTVKSNNAPIPLVLIAGDLVSCLRSALDQIVWQLANVAAKSSTRLAFPIYGENSLDVQVQLTRQTYGIPEGAISIIKSLQPYNSGNAYKTTPLWLLNTLWNIDKHRHLTLHSQICDVQLSATLPQSLRPETTPIDDGLILRFPPGAKPHLDLNPRSRVQVIFGDRQEGIEIGIDWFADVYKFVSETVVPQFATFFA